MNYNTAETIKNPKINPVQSHDTPLSVDLLRMNEYY